MARSKLNDKRGSDCGEGSMKDSIVIVCSGLAGYAVLRELRRFDSLVQVTVLTADDGAAYSKNALSDGLANNRSPADLVVATAEQMAFRHHARVLPFTRVQRIDRQEQVAMTNQGPVPWGRVVLATGAEAIQPRLPRRTTRVYSATWAGTGVLPVHQRLTVSSSQPSRDAKNFWLHPRSESAALSF